MQHWVEDAEGRQWHVAPPKLECDARLGELASDGQPAPESLVVKTEVVLHCSVRRGQPLPDIQTVMRQILSAVTVGGSEGRRIHEIVEA